MAIRVKTLRQLIHNETRKGRRDRSTRRDLTGETSRCCKVRQRRKSIINDLRPNLAESTFFGNRSLLVKKRLIPLRIHSR